MKRAERNIVKYPAIWLIGAFLLCAGIFYAVIGQNARIAVPDNLDLFQPQFQMLNQKHIWFSHGVETPFLHGVTRDDLPSELWLTSVLYMVLPPFAAYVVNYLLKVVIGTVSFTLLALELLKRGVLSGRQGTPRANTSSLAEQANPAQMNLILLCGFAYAVLNFFPTFGICFSSIPLIIWLLLRLDRETVKRRVYLWYLLIFCYPFVSYFSYFGLFILCYMVVALLWSSINKNKHFNVRLFIAIIVLAAGYVVFEYRLFASMLLSDVVTIRAVADMGDLTPVQVLRSMWYAFSEGGMHESGLQQKFVMPVCLIYFVFLNTRYVICGAGKKPKSGALHDIYNLIMLLLVFNSAVYGLYYSKAFRGFVEMLVPPLTGWQFGRTSFFNAFLWYGAFCIVLLRLQESLTARQKNLTASQENIAGKPKIPEKPNHVTRMLPFVAALIAIAVILLSDTTYNDLYHTAHALANQKLRGVTEDSLTYREFYSEALFAKAKEEISYQGEWSAAYGFYPAIPEYNGIATVDGYLGFYPLEYKERFRAAIAPALEKNSGSAAYFDSWGARCYLYSGVSPIIVDPVRHYTHEAEEIDIDPEALRKLDCRYIFSRIRITNADEKELYLKGTFTDESSPYMLYVYELPEL